MPSSTLLVAALALAATVLTTRLVWGRWIYAVGGNPEAARRAAIPVNGVLISVYVLSGLAAGVAACITSGRLNAGSIVALQRARFPIYQLDATAYPGNSGSPLYDPHSGAVVGIINMVFVKGLKESAISNPSGITYAVPVSHARELLQRKNPVRK